ncbi:MAG: hypothetical protein RhofKO_17550 [Rhodothermales bacterium]
MRRDVLGMPEMNAAYNQYEKTEQSHSRSHAQMNKAGSFKYGLDAYDERGKCRIWQRNVVPTTVAYAPSTLRSQK